MEGQATRRLASETSTPRVRPVIIRLILPVIPPRAEVAPIERVLVECVRAERGSACHAANGSTLMCHPSVQKAATGSIRVAGADLGYHADRFSPKLAGPPARPAGLPLTCSDRRRMFVVMAHVSGAWKLSW